MTPLPSPKNLEDVFETMNDHLNKFKALGAIDIFTIRKRFKEVVTSSPARAYAGLGMLALCTNDENEMRANFQRAIDCKQFKMFVHFNYAVSLQKLGCITEAHEHLQLAAQNYDDVAWLDKIAMLAVTFDDTATMEFIVTEANKLKITGPHIDFAAMCLALAFADTADEQASIISSALSDDILRKNSSPITDEEWNHMQKFAADLEQYV